jgi:hypothetical protein
LVGGYSDCGSFCGSDRLLKAGDSDGDGVVLLGSEVVVGILAGGSDDGRNCCGTEMIVRERVVAEEMTGVAEDSEVIGALVD